LRTQVDLLGDLQRTLSVMEEDLVQLRPRAITNGFGSQEAAFSGGQYQDALLEFTRGGLANPLGLPRSELQRVRYVFTEGQLWRQTWFVLDRTDENLQPQSVLLLDNLDAVRVGFLAAVNTGVTPDFYALTSNSGYWESDWNSQQVAADQVAPLPVAVTVTLSSAEFGQVQRVFELP
jgi:general secretion pathway protein J